MCAVVAWHSFEAGSNQNPTISTKDRFWFPTFPFWKAHKRKLAENLRNRNRNRTLDMDMPTRPMSLLERPNGTIYCLADSKVGGERASERETERQRQRQTERQRQTDRQTERERGRGRERVKE